MTYMTYMKRERRVGQWPTVHGVLARFRSFPLVIYRIRERKLKPTMRTIRGMIIPAMAQ